MSQTRIHQILLAIALYGMVMGAQAQSGIAEGLQGILGSLMAGSAGSKAAFQDGAKAIKESFDQLNRQMVASYAAISKQAEEALAVYEREFCDPGSFSPNRKVPATFVGQSFSLTFDSGACYFNDTAFAVDGIRELRCTEPSLTMISNPANFTSSYHKAAEFVSKGCRVSKSFGESTSEVLFSIGDNLAVGETVDITTIAAKVAQEIEKAVGSMAGKANALFVNETSRTSFKARGAVAAPPLG